MVPGSKVSFNLFRNVIFSIGLPIIAACALLSSRLANVDAERGKKGYPCSLLKSQDDDADATDWVYNAA